MALNGAVYNVHPVHGLHPGGWEELVKGGQGTPPQTASMRCTSGSIIRDYWRPVCRQACGRGPAETLMTPPKPPPPSSMKPLTSSTSHTVKATNSQWIILQTDTKITINIYTKREG